MTCRSKRKRFLILAIIITPLIYRSSIAFLNDKWLKENGHLVRSTCRKYRKETEPEVKLVHKVLRIFHWELELMLMFIPVRATLGV